MNDLRNMRNHDHIMHLSGAPMGVNKKISRKATANFAPQALFVEVIHEELRRQVVVTQIYIGGKPQLRDEIPAFMLSKDASVRSIEAGHHLIRERPPFAPLFDPIQAGDEVVVEFSAPDAFIGTRNEGARISVVLAGHLDFETYLKRLSETGSHVRRTLLSIGEREGQTVIGPPTMISKTPDGIETLIMQEHPYEIVRPEWFAVSPECAPFYEIVDLRIGKDSFFWGPMPVPASLFPPLPTTAAEFETFKKYLRLDMPVATPGVVVTLTVRTLKAKSIAERPPFRAALHGITIEP